MKIIITGTGNIFFSKYHAKLDGAELEGVIREALEKNIGFADPNSAYPGNEIFGTIKIEIEEYPHRPIEIITENDEDEPAPEEYPSCF